MFPSYRLSGLRFHARLDFLRGAPEPCLSTTKILRARQAAQSLFQIYSSSLCMIGSIWYVYDTGDGIIRNSHCHCVASSLQIQKFGLRFLSLSEAEKFMNALKVNPLLLAN